MFPEVFGGGESSNSELTDKEQFQKKWGWTGTIDNLAKRDGVDWDQTTEKSILQSLTKLALDADRAEVDRREREQKKLMAR